MSDKSSMLDDLSDEDEDCETIEEMLCRDERRAVIIMKKLVYRSYADYYNIWYNVVTTELDSLIFYFSMNDTNYSYVSVVTFIMSFFNLIGKTLISCVFLPNKNYKISVTPQKRECLESDAYEILSRLRSFYINIVYPNIDKMDLYHRSKINPSDTLFTSIFNTMEQIVRCTHPDIEYRDSAMSFMEEIVSDLVDKYGYFETYLVDKLLIDNYYNTTLITNTIDDIGNRHKIYVENLKGIVETHMIPDLANIVIGYMK